MKKGVGKVSEKPFQQAPVSDASAHATFYLVALTGAPARVREIADWVRGG